MQVAFRRVIFGAVLVSALVRLIPSSSAANLPPIPEPPVAENSRDVNPVHPSESVELNVAPWQSMADTGLWFVGTHRSPQSFDRSCPRFCPTVSRYEECVGYRGSSFQEMTARLDPGVPVCIVIHGSFVDQPSACRDAVSTWNWLRSAQCGHRMQMIYFSWPSYRPITLLAAADVNALGRRAARNGYYLAELLQYLPVESPVCLIGHSHGSRVVAASLHMLSGGAIQGVCHPYARVNGRHIRTVFAASAIDHQWFNPGKRYDRALWSTQCLLNMTNIADPALKLYPLRLPLIAKRPLGLSGLSAWDRRKIGGLSRRVYDYDVSRIIGANHQWPPYIHSRSLAMAIRRYVYFPDTIRATEIVPTTASATSEIAQIR